MLRIVDCARYKRIRTKSESLNSAQAEFVATHIRSCQSCAAVEARFSNDGTLPDMFHAKQKSGEQFANEIISEMTTTRAQKMAVWKPTMIGAMTAVLAMSTFLQILTSEPNIERPKATGAASREAPKSKLTLFESPKTEKPTKKSG
ncbi:MAG: hypothetical protein U0R49_06570 [Fimbriimonadales bacterium]